VGIVERRGVTPGCWKKELDDEISEAVHDISAVVRCNHSNGNLREGERFLRSWSAF